MRVGWLADTTDVLGGAELTQAEFRAAAPEGVEVVDCPPNGVVQGLDRYVVQNCVKYTEADLQRINASTVKYWHDVGPHLQDGVRDWIALTAKQICCSPIQAEYMGLGGALLIPPPVDLSRFEAAATQVNGNRQDRTCCIASWRNLGKGAVLAAEWADQHGGLDFYGGGQLAPPGAQEVPYERMPALLASYVRFLFLPTVIEPFGRLVAEAWAAGCEVITNNLVGARYWIEERPEGMETAASDFWEAVLQ